MLYRTGDSRHTQNIQINKVIGENEKCAFFHRKNLNGLFGQPNKPAKYLIRYHFVLVRFVYPKKIYQIPFCVKHSSLFSLLLLLQLVPMYVCIGVCERDTHTEGKVPVPHAILFLC